MLLVFLLRVVLETLLPAQNAEGPCGARPRSYMRKKRLAKRHMSVSVSPSCLLLLLSVSVVVLCKSACLFACCLACCSVLPVSRFLPCLRLSLLTRFPFHDSQVLCWSFRCPKTPQEALKRPPRRAKSGARGTKRRQESRKRRQEAPRRPRRPFWIDFWSILEPPGAQKTLNKH